MKPRKQGSFYTERKPIDAPVVAYDTEADWWVASDIKREIVRKYGKYVSFTVIGAVAKKCGLVRQTSFGFKLYHKDLVDIIGRGRC